MDPKFDNTNKNEKLAEKKRIYVSNKKALAEMPDITTPLEMYLHYQNKPI